MEIKKPLTMAERNLSRQMLFAKNVFAGMTGKAAAAKAGYSDKGDSAGVAAGRLNKTPAVIEELKRLNEIARSDTRIDEMFVLKNLRDLALDAKRDSDKISALKLLGQHLKLFVDQVETTVIHDVSELKEFSLEELRELRQQPQIIGSIEVIEDTQTTKSPTD